MKKTRYKVTVAYDGTHFSGYQVQPNARTVQGELEKALIKIAKGETIRVHGAGRTDAGVHARGQVIHFDLPFYIHPKGLLTGLNTSTPEDVTIVDVEEAEADFHARYLAKGKMYTYRVDNSRFANPFKRLYAYHHRYPMERKRVEKALKHMEGTHDFTSFASTHSDKEDKVRTIYQASVSVDEETNEWLFTFVGNGFLYNMIRILMGTLLEVADGRREADDIPHVIEAKDREAAGTTLSPVGLCMEKVYYEDQEMPGILKEDHHD